MNQDKAKQFLRSALVGGAVAVTYVLLYLSLKSAGVAHVLANGLAFFQAIVLQYACHSTYPTHRPLKDRAQVIRFSGMLGLGFIISMLITGPFAKTIALADWKAAVVVTVVLPLLNYVLLTTWVFADPVARTDAPS